MTVRHPYPGKDLEAMSFAINYHRWILDEMRPYLGRNIAEVGAGTGSFSEMLLAESLDSLTLIEPSEMFDALKNNISSLGTTAKINLHNSTFAEAVLDRAPPDGVDSIIYVNVLEHIEDDEAELGLMHKGLEIGGRCFIFVPALMSLYGNFDRAVGHVRRYSKTELEKKCATAGFKVIKSKYFDIAGVLPWYIKYKLLRSDSLSAGAVEFYDKMVVPVASRLERILRVPVGKNILLIAEK